MVCILELNEKARLSTLVWQLGLGVVWHSGRNEDRDKATCQVMK